MEQSGEWFALAGRYFHSFSSLLDIVFCGASEPRTRFYGRLNLPAFDDFLFQFASTHKFGLLRKARQRLSALRSERTRCKQRANYAIASSNIKLFRPRLSLHQINGAHQWQWENK